MKKLSLNEQMEIWRKEREANPTPCKCGSIEHESETMRGLSGMTVISYCPVEAANKATQTNEEE